MNIHLKAFGGVTELFYAENSERDNTHVTELGNIIGRLLTLMGGDESGAAPDTSKTPIYLCGDFNNPKSKLDLVQSAVRTVHDYAFSEPDPGEEEAVSLASFGSQTTHSRRGTKERASKTSELRAAPILAFRYGRDVSDVYSVRDITRKNPKR